MKDTPLLNQYNSFKNKYPDKIVLFRMGDFFETFGDDAKITSKVLNITLTQRSKKDDPTPLAGFPHHALNQYLPKLVQANYSVVIVDQIEDPKLAKGIVKRAITQIVTPGTIDIESTSHKNNTVMALSSFKKKTGFALCDLYKGEIIVGSINSSSDILKIITSHDVVEIITPEKEKQNILKDISISIPIQIAQYDTMDKSLVTKTVKNQYEIASLFSLGLDQNYETASALALLIYYFNDTQKTKPQQLGKPVWLPDDKYLTLDQSTIVNLDLIDSRSGYSLFSVLDNCQTYMGKRFLRYSILKPLLQKKDVEERLSSVDFFYNKYDLLTNIRKLLSEISDIERISSRIGMDRANARDYKALEQSIIKALEIKEIVLSNVNSTSMDNFSNKISELEKNLNHDSFDILKNLLELISLTIIDNPPLAITEGGIIKEGYNKELDELRAISHDSKSWLKDFENNEKQRTGITSLKVSFNKVFGYYIEITNSYKDKVPESYIRKQTLTNCERYITEELKQKEEIILNAHDKISELEYNLFQAFRQETVKYIDSLQIVASTITKIDLYTCFAFNAINYSYIKPEIVENSEITIKDGRHPVVEKALLEGKSAINENKNFIPNDTLLDNNKNNLILITGPNMSGKSTYIRQVALLVLMTHMGSFIPASMAKISPVDRIFTRIGANDDLAQGRSTFMVEMDEVANITNNATKNSLIILDEVGRGTSTYDGISIAWAIADFLVNKIGAKTVFATHYHELLKLEDLHPEKVKNYNVAVLENPDTDDIVFLRKIEQGGTDKSYGIYVAKLAGLQKEIITEAKKILSNLSTDTKKIQAKKSNSKKEDKIYPQSLF